MKESCYSCALVEIGVISMFSSIEPNYYYILLTIESIRLHGYFKLGTYLT